VVIHQNARLRAVTLFVLGAVFELFCVSTTPQIANADTIKQIVNSEGPIAAEGTFNVHLGETFGYNINALGFLNTFAVQLDVVFEPAVLQVMEAKVGPFLSDGGKGPTVFIPGLVRNSSGHQEWRKRTPVNIMSAGRGPAMQIQSPSSETLNLLLKTKFDVLTILVHAFMIWWVSATAFCGSIVAVTWSNRRSLREITPGSTKILCVVVFIFFTSIHTFGWLGMVETTQLQRDTDAILSQLGVPNGEGYGHTEFFWFKYSILLANVSFVLVSLLWIAIGYWLLKGSRALLAGHHQNKSSGPDISANVIKGVHELLEERGIQPEPDETFEDMVARALCISRRQSEILLESLHDGASVDEAVAAAEVDTSYLEGDLLVRIARAIGTALGRVNRT
jgi:hypothetical protein